MRKAILTGFILLLTASLVQAQTTYYSKASAAWNLASTWSTVGCGNSANTGTYPVAGDIVNICSGHNVTVVRSNEACASLTVNNGATLTLGNNTTPRTLTVSTFITINGTITCNNPGSSTTHIINVGADWTNNGTFTSSSSNGNGHITVVMNGSSAQNIGGSSATTFYNLTLNNTSGAMLGNNQTITNGTLRLTNGKITLGDHNLTLNTNNAVAGAPGSSNYIVFSGTGRLIKNVTPSTGNYLFPIGTDTIYSPATFHLTGGTVSGASLTINLIEAPHPNIPPGATNYINRYWTYTPGGTFTNPVYTATFTYVQEDVVGPNETAIMSSKYNGSWTQYTVTDAANNVLTIIGATTFGDYTGWGDLSVNITPEHPEVCDHGSVQLDGHPTGGTLPYTTHLWVGSGAVYLNNINIQNPVFSNAPPGLYALTYSVKDSKQCVATQDITVTVNYLLTANISPDPADVCDGDPLQLNGNPGGGSGTYVHLWTGTGAVYLSANNIEDPVFSGAPPGTYNLTYTVTDTIGGCNTSDNITITVNNLPSADITPDPAVLCADGSLDMNGNPSGGSGTYSIHKWEGSGSFYLDLTNIPNPVFSGAPSGDYYLSYTVTDDNGCQAFADITVTVNSGPSASITPDPAVLCAGGSLPLFGNPSGGSGTYTTHLWTGSGAVYLSATNIEDPIFSGASSGTYDLTYTVTDNNGCSGSDNITVTINTVSAGSIAADQTICQNGDPAPFNSITPGTGAGTITYRWERSIAPFTDWEIITRRQRGDL